MGREKKTVGIKDIAGKAGVSASTVSAILNNSSSNIRISAQTREKVLQIAEELNYRPNFFAKSLRTRKSFLAHVIVWDITDPYFGEILKGIEQVLKQRGYQLLLSSADGDPENSCYARIEELPVDGVIIVGGPNHGIAGAEETAAPVPVVFIGLDQQLDASCSVTVNNYRGGAIGAEYLLSLGRETLYYVTKKASFRTHDEEERLRGFLETVGLRGSPTTKRQKGSEPIVGSGRQSERGAALESGAESGSESDSETGRHWKVVETDENLEGGYSSVVSLVQERAKPVCIFADDDLIALGIIRALQDRGFSVPGDAAVLGFDDLSISAYTQPRLTTLNQPRLEMGISGAECLLKLIEEEHVPELRKVLQPSLVRRDSA